MASKYANGLKLHLKLFTQDKIYNMKKISLSINSYNLIYLANSFIIASCVLPAVSGKTHMQNIAPMTEQTAREY